MNKIIRFILAAFIMTSIAMSPMANVLAQADNAGMQLAPLSSVQGKIIPNQYIVVLKPSTNMDIQTSAIADVQKMGGNVLYRYGSSIKGFSAVLSPKALIELRKNPQVAYIEPDQVVSVNPIISNTATASDTVTTYFQTSANWGLDRVDQLDLPLNSLYSYTRKGAGVHVYVIDSGIKIGHVDFGSRLTMAYDYQTGKNKGNDCNGNGTFIAGIIGGSTYGIAKSASLYSVRVLDCNGVGSYSRVIAGIDWVAANYLPPAIANISFEALQSAALSDAINAAIAEGITVTLGAGNKSLTDLECTTYYPANTNAIKVGATLPTDVRAAFSNYGAACVDVYAPGSGITSDWMTDTKSTYTMSGTGPASGFAAGAAALYLEENPLAGPAEVADALIDANPDKVTEADGTPADPTSIIHTYFATATTVPIPVSPRGLMTDTNPDYTWMKVDGAESYNFRLYKASKIVSGYPKTILDADCGADPLRCTYTAPTSLSSGNNYTWMVNATVGGKASSYSPALPLTIVSIDSGFSSLFTSNSTNWSSVAGSWSRQSGGYFYTKGEKGKFSSAVHSYYYGPMTYTVNMKRTGTCATCSNYVLVRGITTPLDKSNNEWNSGFEFVYSNSGYFAVWKIDNNAYTALQTWVADPSIRKLGWNKIQVIAEDNGDGTVHLQYVINDVKVWDSALDMATDPTSASFGKVGFGMYTDNTKDGLSIDAAILESTPIFLDMPFTTRQNSGVQGPVNPFHAPK